MNNNPINEIDPLGNTPAHVVAGIIGPGVNVYNNWGKIVKNSWSILGYAGTGAVAGAASLSPGGAVLAAKITAGGNFATDLATGNLPDINSLSDLGGYALESGLNALDVAGAGKVANAGLKGLKKLGLDVLPDAASQLSSSFAEEAAEDIMVNWINGWEKYLDGITISASRSYAGQMALGSLISNPLRGAVSGQLGLHGNSVNSPRPSGYYEIEYASGRKYHGVGDQSRMLQSANQKANYYSDPIKNKTFTKTGNRAEAYALEQKGIDRDGLFKNGKTYNKINSPGKKLLLKLLR